MKPTTATPPSAEPAQRPRLLDEELMSITAATKLLPGRNGRIASVTVYRWIREGVDGRRLEAVKVGGHYFTSKQAIDRFVSASTETIAPKVRGHRPGDRTEAQRNRDSAKATEALRLMGVF